MTTKKLLARAAGRDRQLQPTEIRQALEELTKKYTQEGLSAPRAARRAREEIIEGLKSQKIDPSAKAKDVAQAFGEPVDAPVVVDVAQAKADFDAQVIRRQSVAKLLDQNLPLARTIHPSPVYIGKRGKPDYDPAATYDGLVGLLEDNKELDAVRKAGLKLERPTPANAAVVDINQNGKLDPADVIVTNVGGSFKLRPVGKENVVANRLGEAAKKAAAKLHGVGHEFGDPKPVPVDRARHPAWIEDDPKIEDGIRIKPGSKKKPSDLMKYFFENECYFDCSTSITLMYYATQYQMLDDLVGPAKRDAEFDKLFPNMVIGPFKNVTLPGVKPVIGPAYPGVRQFQRNPDVDLQGRIEGYPNENMTSVGGGKFFAFPLGFETAAEVDEVLTANRGQLRSNRKPDWLDDLKKAQKVAPKLLTKKLDALVERIEEGNVERKKNEAEIRKDPEDGDEDADARIDAFDGETAKRVLALRDEVHERLQKATGPQKRKLQNLKNALNGLLPRRPAPARWQFPLGPHPKIERRIRKRSRPRVS